MTTLESSPPNVLSRTIPLAFVGHFSAYKSSRLECAEQIFAEANKNSAAFSLLGTAVTPSYHMQRLPHSVNRRDAIKPQESPIKVDASQITYFGRTKRTGDGKCAMPSPSAIASMGHIQWSIHRNCIIPVSRCRTFLIRSHYAKWSIFHGPRLVSPHLLSNLIRGPSRYSICDYMLHGYIFIYMIWWTNVAAIIHIAEKLSNVRALCFKTLDVFFFRAQLDHRMRMVGWLYADAMLLDVGTMRCMQLWNI